MSAFPVFSSANDHVIGCRIGLFDDDRPSQDTSNSSSAVKTCDVGRDSSFPLVRIDVGSCPSRQLLFPDYVRLVYFDICKVHWC